MVYCRGCGKEIHETAPTCPHCGFVQLLLKTTNENVVTDSIWMSITSFVCAVISFLNWFEIKNWTEDIKLGLWMFSIVSIIFAIATLQQKRKGVVLAGLSLTVSVITILILIGKI